MLKELVVPIKGGRDDGKIFTIKEMPAYHLEGFWLRLIAALGTSGISVPQDIADAGLVGLAILAYQAFMGAKPEAIMPLRDEMMQQCVWHTPSPEVSMPWSPTLVFDVSTLLTLREKWLELHTGFTLAEAVQKLNAAMKDRALMLQSMAVT